MSAVCFYFDVSGDGKIGGNPVFCGGFGIGPYPFVGKVPGYVGVGSQERDGGVISGWMRVWWSGSIEGGNGAVNRSGGCCVT